MANIPLYAGKIDNNDKKISSSSQEFKKGVKIIKSTAREIIASFTFKQYFSQKSVEGDDGRTYRRYLPEEGFGLTDEVGKPMLPVKHVKLQVPSDSDSFSIEIIEDNSEMSPIPFHEIYPTPEIYFEEENGFPIEKERFAKDEKAYGKDQLYPSNQLVEIAGTAFFRQIKMLKIKLYPVQYNPAQGMLTECRSLKLRIRYTSAKPSNEVIADTTSSFHPVAKEILPNYSFQPQRDEEDEEGEWDRLDREDIISEDPRFIVDYLVICTDAFIDSESLEEWCDYRVSEAGGGYNIGTVALSDIYAQYDERRPPEENIKDCIQFIYDNWREDEDISNLSFVLLIGDADRGANDENWFLPVWGGIEFHGEEVIGDNNYACVEGDDAVPELIIGRFPVKTMEELDAMVQKTLDFEQHPPDQDEENHWGTRSLYLGGYGIGTVFTLIPMHGLRDRLLEQNLELIEMNANDPGYGYDNESAGAIIANEGCLLVSYSGHGSVRGWHPGGRGLISYLEDHEQEDLPVVVFSFACRTGCFDNRFYDCYGESWVKTEGAGSVAFLGASRLSHAGANYMSTRRLLEYIFENEHENYILGESILYEKVNSRSDTQRQSYNLLGDPALNFTNHIGRSTKSELYTSSLFIEVDPDNEEESIVNIQIENIGETDAEGIIVRLFEIFDNGRLEQVGDDHEIDFLESGDMVALQQPWQFGEDISVRFYVTVDPDNEIPELSQYNNHLLNGSYEGLLFIAESIYVDASNEGEENGSLEHPFNTIGEAVYCILRNREIDQLVTINIMEGVYQGEWIGQGEEEMIGSIYDIHFRGIGDIGNIIIRDSQIYGLCSSTTVENLTFDNSLLHMYSGNIIGNVFKDCEEAIINRGGYLRGNVFYGNDIAFGFGTQWNDGDGETIFINNTVINNGAAFRFPDDRLREHGTILRNNIILGNGELIGNIELADVSSDYNVTDDGIFLNLDETNFNDDPLFVDTDNYDFHLREGSPCINAGHPDRQYNDRDGSRNDIGAFYFSQGEDVIEQSIELTEGWNLISFNVDVGSMNVVEVLAPLIEDEVLIMAKDSSGMLWSRFGYDPEPLGIEHAYHLKVNRDAVLTVEAPPIQYPVTITLEPGWNFVGYPAQGEGLIEEILEELLEEEKISMIKDGDGRFCAPSYNFYGFRRLEPGKGYLIEINGEEDVSFELTE